MLEYTADILGQHRTKGTAGFGGSFAPLCGAALGNSSIEERLSETAPAERFRSTHAFVLFIIRKALTFLRLIASISKIPLYKPGNPCYNPVSSGPVVQSVSTPACHAGGRRFESVPGRHRKAIRLDGFLLYWKAVFQFGAFPAACSACEM